MTKQINYSEEIEKLNTIIKLCKNTLEYTKKRLE